MPLILNIIKKQLLKFINLKAIGLVLAITTLIFTLLYLNKQANFYKQKAEAIKKEVLLLEKEKEEQIKDIQIKTQLETRSLLKKQEHNYYLQELKKEVEKRDKKALQNNKQKRAKVIQKIKPKKKELLNAKNKEPPNSCCTSLQF